ncbi:GNAT family N-acetyltransferase [Kytococcus sedentarius]|uniref:GNAT family N-acetyltransferase n=1 Tax=Kytococcus sedentarius TaxID=1276 RepID=UPI0035BC6275
MREIHTHHELLQTLGDDPYVRWGVPPTLPAPVLVHEGAAATLRVRHRLGQVRRSAFLVGHGPGMTELVEHVLASGLIGRWGASGISVPAEHGHLLDAHRIEPGGKWDWMWVTEPVVSSPRVTTSERLGLDAVITLDDSRDAAEIAAFSEKWSPTAEGEPGSGYSTLWRGVRAGAAEGRPTEGELVAVGASQPFTDEVPHLAGIVTRGDLRGQGLGRLVTEALTLAEVGRTGVCTLGMYSDNDAARRLYHSIGYTTAYAWDSRRWEDPTAG